jgi:hypothetical protein
VEAAFIRAVLTQEPPKTGEQSHVGHAEQLPSGPLSCPITMFFCFYKWWCPFWRWEERRGCWTCLWFWRCSANKVPRLALVWFSWVPPPRGHFSCKFCSTVFWPWEMWAEGVWITLILLLDSSTGAPSGHLFLVTCSCSHWPHLALHMHWGHDVKQCG